MNSASTATIDQKLEVVVIPVADVERAKRFYAGLGWRVDADFASGDSWRLVQMTPPGSSCSVMFGTGFTTAVPGSIKERFSSSTTSRRHAPSSPDRASR
jgi:catechol 2,3-dioxygenase-like lactoylglutathione lyase family enzyme